DRDRAALGVPAAEHRVHALPQHDPARERPRPDRLRPAADGAASFLHIRGLLGHARPAGRSEPRQRARRAGVEPVRGDAEPARGRCADRRRGARLRDAPVAAQGSLAALAGLGLVRRDGDGQPLLARRVRRRDAGDPRTADRLPKADLQLPRALDSHSRNAMRESAVLHRVKQGYTTGARSLASRSIIGLTRTRVTPNALTTAGVSLCLAAAVLVYFEYRNEILFYWVGAVVFVVGSILDILDGALA